MIARKMLVVINEQFVQRPANALQPDELAVPLRQKSREGANLGASKISKPTLKKPEPWLRTAPMELPVVTNARMRLSR